MSSGDFFFKVKTPDEVRQLLLEVANLLPAESAELSENVLG